MEIPVVSAAVTPSSDDDDGDGDDGDERTKVPSVFIFKFVVVEDDDDDNTAADIPARSKKSPCVDCKYVRTESDNG